jgi:hypothetical protein
MRYLVNKPQAQLWWFGLGQFLVATVSYCEQVHYREVDRAWECLSALDVVHTTKLCAPGHIMCLLILEL